MLRFPAPSRVASLRDLPLPELGPRARELLTRICACLYVVNRPENQVRAILAGYTPQIHSEGAYLASVVSGQRSFAEWRTWRSLRPTRDPALPALVDELARFADRWLSRALAAAASVADPDDRAELESYLGQFDRPSRTWRAKSVIACVEHLGEVPEPFYQDTWAALVAQGITAELPRFHEVLKSVQESIATAPIDEDEIADIQAMREDTAASIGRWLEARRAQFQGHFGDETLTLLALGEQAPPTPPDVPIHLLAHFRHAARA